MQNIRLIHAGVAVAAATFIVYGSWVPFQFQHIGTHAAIEQLRQILDEPWQWRGSRVDWAINGLITMPLGFCALGALLAGRQGLFRSTAAALLVLSGSVCLSVTVELGQLWLDGRVTSVKDVAAQTMGTAGGIIAYLVLGWKFDDWLAEFVSERGPENRTQWVLQAYVVGFFGYSMLPLDVVMSTGELSRKFDSGKIEIVPFTYPYASLMEGVYSLLTQAILAVPVGMWSVIPSRKIHLQEQSRSFFDAVLVAAGVLIAIEAAQLLIVSRYSSTTDVLVGVTGAIVGVAVMGRLRERHTAGPPQAADQSISALKWLAAFAGYASVLAIVFWAPYDFSADKALIKQRLEAFQAIPFLRMHSGSNMNSLFNTIRTVIWFTPLGALAAICAARLPASPGSRRLGFFIAAVIVAGWAAAIELGQILLPSRFADSTDVILGAAGGWLGLAVTARLNALRARAESLSERS